MSDTISPSQKLRRGNPAAWLPWLARVAGVDFHVGTVLLFRFWSIAAGSLMLFAVPLWLTQVQQGYYYTFASVLALQVFFELGVNQVITQVVSHEAAHLETIAGGSMKGPSLHLGRLSSVVRLLHRWYLAAATLFLIVIGMAGTWFFQNFAELGSSEWLLAWWLLVAASACNLYLSPSLAVLEGCGRVGQTARVRLLQSMAGYLLLWLGLAGGLGLYAIAAVPLAAAVGTAVWLKTHDHPLDWLIRHRPGDPAHEVRWRTEILPFQWRIAVSWISGYFIFQLFTPVVFARHGAVEAGRIGIALSIFNAVLTLGVSWINARLPAMAAHIAHGRRQELNALFHGVLKRSILFTVAASFAVLSAVAALQALDVGAVGRIAGLPVLACLSAVAVANTFVSGAATYMRAHKEEPMLLVSVTTAAFMLLTIEFASRHSVLAMIGGYAAVTLLVTTPWTLRLLLAYHAR